MGTNVDVVNEEGRLVLGERRQGTPQIDIADDGEYPLSIPRCTAAKVWESAVVAGVPRDASASLVLGRSTYDGVKATWFLNVPSARFRAFFDAETCKQL